MLPLGFASGLPLALTSGTLQAWLTVEGVDLATIGWFSLIGLPYTVKFLWAPVMDRFVPPWLGRRRGWMLVTQTGLMAGVIGMALTGPGASLPLFGALALLVAFLSASQDIVFDAYRTDLLQPAERGLGAAVWVAGYRVALLVAGALALLLADRVGWTNAYLAMAGCMAVGLAAIVGSPEPPAPADAPHTLAEAVQAPVMEFLGRPSAWALILLVALYKVGDALAAALNTPFLITGLGFSPSDVGSMKGLGLGATLAGAMVGGTLLPRLGLVRSLLLFGLLQALSNLGFMALAWAGKDYGLLVAAVLVENLSGGMGTAAFVALVMGLCDRRYTATQFAALSSVEALGRVLLGRPSAQLVDLLGWPSFFGWSALAALPGLWLVWHLRRLVAAREAP